MTAKKNNLSFNSILIATITADKTMFLPFLCLSFHLQAVGVTVFLTSRLLFLNWRAAGKLWEGVTERERLSPPLALMCLERDTIPELLHLSCLKTLGSSQSSECVAGSDFIHPFKKYTQNRKLSLRHPHAHTRPASSSSHSSRAWHRVKWNL